MKRYWVRVQLANGGSAVLQHRNRTEWTKKTAMKHANAFFINHGCICYVEEA